MKPGATEQINRYSKYEDNIEITARKVVDSETDRYDYLTGGDNIPDCYAMTYIIKN